jgi:precorrin-6B methylase 2
LRREGVVHGAPGPGFFKIGHDVTSVLRQISVLRPGLEEAAGIIGSDGKTDYKNLAAQEDGLPECNGATANMISTAQEQDVRTICESGFNGGDTALLWLIANPLSRVYSFDSGKNPKANDAAQFLQENLVDEEQNPRLELILGDALEKIPAFRTDVRCDLIHISSNEDGVNVDRDIENFALRAKPKAKIVVNNVQCSEAKCATPRQLIEKLLARGVVRMLPMSTPCLSVFELQQ